MTRHPSARTAEPRTAAGRWVVDVIPEPFDLGSGPYYIVHTRMESSFQEADDVPERAVFYTEADAELFRRAIEAEAAAPLDVDELRGAWNRHRVNSGHVGDCHPDYHCPEHIAEYARLLRERER